MAKGSDKVDKKPNETKGNKPENLNENAPKRAYPEGERDEGAGAGREQVVRKEPKSSFDERTSVSQPFMTSDGRQNNGQEDLEEKENK